MYKKIKSQNKAFLNNLKVYLKNPFLNTFIISLKKSNETSNKVFVEEKV